MQNLTLADGTVIRPLVTHDDRVEAVRVQEETWGVGFSEKVPAAILLVAEKTGGIAAGAFAPSGRMLGFVFGLTGVRSGQLVHWSDILAVREAAQGRRLGEAMKRYQRERCLAIGVDRMYWTFDPFVARNAHLNLHVLGASVDEFVPDMYGSDTGSRLHGALGTDRFIALWPISRDPHAMRDDPALIAGRPVAGGKPGDAPEPDAPLPDSPDVLVRIPDDYSALLAGDPEIARAWRTSARRAFLHYLHGGYRITAFVPGRGSDATYLLSAI